MTHHIRNTLSSFLKSTNMKHLLFLFLGFSVFLFPLQARIKLTTLPERQSTRVDINNGRQTLVEEERTVNLQAGRNQVDFSWANIHVTKESIVFRVINAEGEVNVINTNYPPGENALYWTVSASKAGPAVIRISYLISNLMATPSYQGIVENDEKTMLFRVYMTATNTSGEDFGQSTIQPGVGRTEVSSFLNGEKKRMLASKFASVDIEKLFVFDPSVNGKETRMFYRLYNDKDHGLGSFPLARGKVRLFIKEGKDSRDSAASQAFLGEDWAPYTPLYGKMDLFVGTARDVKVERFNMPPEGGPRNRYITKTVTRHLFNDTGKDKADPRFRDERTRLRYRLQNFKTLNGKPIAVPLTIREKVDGEWEIEKVVMKEISGERNDTVEKEISSEAMFSYKRIDIGHVEFEVDLPPTRVDLKYDLFVTILRKNRRF